MAHGILSWFHALRRAGRDRKVVIKVEITLEQAVYAAEIGMYLPLHNGDVLRLEVEQKEWINR